MLAVLKAQEAVVSLKGLMGQGNGCADGSLYHHHHHHHPLSCLKIAPFAKYTHNYGHKSAIGMVACLALGAYRRPPRTSLRIAPFARLTPSHG